MYEWAMLFMFCVLLSTYHFLRDHSVSSQVCLVIFGVLAAYTHLYCLIILAMIYLALILAEIKTNKELIKSTIFCGFMTFICYIPWIAEVLSAVNRVSEDYWQQAVPTFLNITGYLFGSPHMFAASLGLTIFIVAVLAYDIWKRSGSGENRLMEAKGENHYEKTVFVWIVVFSLFATLAIGYITSAIMRPVFLERYIYAITIGLWISLGLCISRFKKKEYLYAAVIAIILIFAMPITVEQLKENAEQNKETGTFLDLTSDISEGDTIYTDNASLTWMVLEYYYPDTDDVLFKDETDFPDIPGTKQSWLFLEESLSEDLKTEIESQGYTATTIVEDTYLSEYKTWAYRLDESA